MPGNDAKPSSCGVEISAHFFNAGRYLVVSTLACLQVTVTHWLRERSEFDVGGGELCARSVRKI